LPEAQARFTQDRIDAIRKIGVLAAERSVEFVVVAGDVFESNQVAPQTVMRALDALGTIPVPVFLLPANHDPLDSVSVYRSRTFADKKPKNVHVVGTSEPLAVPGVEGVDVVGAPWHSKRQLTDTVAELTASLQPRPSGTICVMLAHGIIDKLSPDPDAPDLINLANAEAAIHDGRIHYLALGDRHSTTDISETGAIWYSGTHVATSFRDENPGNVLLAEIADDRSVSVEVLPVDETAAWRFVEQGFDLTDLDDVEAVKAFLDEQPDKARTIVRLALAGQRSSAITSPPFASGSGTRIWQSSRTRWMQRSSTSADMRGTPGRSWLRRPRIQARVAGQRRRRSPCSTVSRGTRRPTQRARGERRHEDRPRQAEQLPWHGSPRD